MSHLLVPSYLYPACMNINEHCLPRIPKIEGTNHENINPIQDTFIIFYIESHDSVWLKCGRYCTSPDFLTASSPYQALLNTYVYFLFFARLNQKSHRYGLYFNPKSLSLLEIKLTLYTLNHHPIELQISKKNGDILIHQLCFNHINFCFYLDWELCKYEELNVQMHFIQNYKYQFELKFKDFLLL